MTEKISDKKIKRIHLFYYWSSGVVSILEGIFILLTLGLVKVSWGIRYCSYWSKKMSDIRLMQIGKWVSENPNQMTFPKMTPDGNFFREDEMWEKVEVGNWVQKDNKWMKVTRVKKDFGVCIFYTDVDGYGIINPLNITAYSVEEPHEN